MDLIEDMSYEQIVQSLRNLPATWYPALITEMVEAAYKKNVFKDGGASRIIQNAEKRLGKPAPLRCGININYAKGEEENITVVLGPPGMPACDAVTVVQEMIAQAPKDHVEEEWGIVWETIRPGLEELGFVYVEDWDKAVI